MVTKPGRFWFSVPRPYWIQAPIEGRMAAVAPQCRNRVAGPWATPSVCREWMKQRSSTCLFVSGNRDEAQRPDSPCWAKSQSGLMTRCSVPLVPVLAISAGVVEGHVLTVLAGTGPACSRRSRRG